MSLRDRQFFFISAQFSRLTLTCPFFLWKNPSVSSEMKPLQVPCVAVVENMSYFEVDGVRHFPFGKGSGDRIVKDYGLSNLVRFPIVAELSAAGDGEAAYPMNHPSPLKLDLLFNLI